VSMLPSRENYEWKCTQNSDCLISIKLPQPGRYFIAVTSSWPCAFTITGSLDETLIELQDGTPFSSSLVTHTWQYFSFSVNKKKDLTFAVTVMTGDPDLYVSVGNRPTAQNYTWRAMSYGSDALFIGDNDEKACSNCVYILGVYAFSDSSFTVTAAYESIIELSDGTPNHGNLVFGMMRYYSFRAVNATATITISATIISGKLELYVNNGTLKPTRTDFKYSSAHFGHVTGEIIVIDHDPCLGVSQCIYTILVYARWDVEYNLVAETAHSTRVLQNSVPVSDMLGKQEWDFYSYQQMEISDLQIVMTPISGEPKMFVRKGERPTAQDRDWGPVEGAGQIIIKAADPDFYYIGVYSGNSDSTFSLSAISQTAGNRSKNEEGVNLVDGVSSYGSVLKDGFTYFTFVAGPSNTDKPKNASFSITALRGSPEMYIKHETQPSIDSYDYKLTEDLTSLNIKGAVPLNSKATWNIGVYGRSSEADFYITAIIQDSVQVLQQGVPTTGHLKAGKFAYFIIESKAATKDIHINVVPLIGMPSVWVSKSVSMPNASCYDYVGFQNALGVSVIVPFANITGRTLHMTLGAGNWDTYFQVVVYYQELVPLIEGFSQQFELGSDSSNVFVWRVPEANIEDKSLLISVSPIVGYVEFWIGVWMRPKIGDPTTYQWSSEQDGLTIKIEDTDPYFKRPAIYYTNVHCQKESEKCQFYILVQSTGGNYQLQAGAPVTAVARVGQYQYYSLMVDDKKLESLSIIVTAILGRTSLYCSLYAKRPTSENFQWESKEGALTISKKDPSFANKGTYYFSVKGLESINEFSIVASQEFDGRSMKPIILVLDRKQAAIVDSNRVRISENLYTYRSDSKPMNSDQLCFQIQILQGKLSLYYQNDGSIPSKEHTIKGFEDEMDDFLIPITDPCMTCEYLVLIQAEPGTIYSLTVKRSKAEESKRKYRGYNRSFHKILFIASIIAISIALFVVCYCVRKHNRLRRELLLTELELNQHGIEGPRQRRKEDIRKGTLGAAKKKGGSGYQALILDGEEDRTSPTDITPMLT